MNKGLEISLGWIKPCFYANLTLDMLGSVILERHNFGTRIEDTVSGLVYIRIWKVNL